MIDRMKSRSRVRHINRHLSRQVGITTSSRTGSRGNTLDPDTSELNTRAWSSHLMPTDTTFLLTGLCPQSLCTILKDVLRRYKSQMASESDLLPHTTKLSQFWVLLHGQRGWYRGGCGGRWPKIHTKDLQQLLSSRLFLMFKIFGGQLKSFHGGIKARSFWNKKKRDSAEMPQQHRLQKD